MRNSELAEVLGQIGDFLALQGENHFKIRAYRRGAEAIRALSEDVANIAARRELRRITGIGEALEAKIISWLATGRVPLLDKLRERFPAGLLDVMTVPGVGPKLTARLYEELGVRDLDSLEAAVEAKQLRTLKGCGPRTEERIAQGIRQMRDGHGRFPIGQVLPRAVQLKQWLADLPGARQVAIAGSLRRGCEMVKDIDIVIATDHIEPIRAALAQVPGLESQPNQGETKTTLELMGGLSVDIRLVPEQSFVTALHHFTGSKAHHVRLRERARRQGWRISEYNLMDLNQGIAHYPKSEEALYRLFGLPYIAPELREDQGEFEASLNDAAPQIVKREHLQGDIHVHSTWSDGRMSLATIARVAAKMGLEYVVICDHSPALRITRGLDAERLAAQADEIDALNAANAGAWLFKGIEVDILADGTLDLPDTTLERLDLVVASVHTGFGQTQDEMTGRIMRAMEHPHVDVIGHPTGRKLGRRPPYAVDVDALIGRAVATGTVLEINASPARMDLGAEHARKALQAGAMLTVNSDAHDIVELGNFDYGLMVARRAGAGPYDLLNSRSLAELRTWLRRPKAERTQE